MSHSQSDPFEGVAIDGDENACVDFRYTPHPRMDWWFDHHISAFQPASLREQFAADRSGKKFIDPEARSCTLFIRDTLRERFGYEPEDAEGHWSELLEWADKIDGAVFESAREIVELKAPALKLMVWLKTNRDVSLATRLIECLGREALSEIVSSAWVQERLPALLEAHHRVTELIARELHFDGRVASYDLSGHQADASNGFAVYMLAPDSVYSIGLVLGKRSLGISVGRNPWCREPGEHNLARICERYGGGGHAHVAGITMPTEELARAREIVEEIRQTLHRDPAAVSSPAAT